jgi:radical SAM protein with 4Fe4S-binding SPASM domain
MKQLSRPSGNLSYELFKKIIDEVHSNLIYLTLYFQGEPFLNKQFFDFFAYAKARNIYVSTSTNAHFLYDDNCRKIIESGLDRIIISMDGMTQDTYSSYRKNGNIDDVIKGIVNLVSLRKKLGSRKPFIILQFLVLKTNEHEINEIKKFVKDYGIDSLQLKSAQFYNYINGNPLMPSDEKYSRYSRQNDGTYRIKSPLQNHCFRMWTSAVITWDGTVVPCCFDKNADYRLGSLNDATFSSIWRSKEYVQFRNKIITCRKSINICTNCISC